MGDEQLEFDRRAPVAELKVERRERDGVRFVAAAGELDMSNVGALREATSGLRNDALGMVIDLRSASFIDSATIGLLFELRGGLRRRRQALRVVCTPGSTPRRVLEMMSFDPETLSEPDPDAAVEAILREVSPRDLGSAETRRPRD